MLPKMRYRLGLDLGTSSVGWCLIRLNQEEKPVAVIRMGVRIFPDGRNPKDGSSLAVTRRQARQARRRRDRLLKRKTRMTDALIKHGFFPDDKAQRKALVTLSPYVLRKKGLDEVLTGAEFARALFHINQRRGFKSNRKTDKADNDSGALKKAIRELRLKLEHENCRTLGEWLANRYERGESVRARLRGKSQKDKAYDFYADRRMVEHEFDTLWEKQSEYNPALFNAQARTELKDILLFQRLLKPVVPGRCTLLPEEKRAPRALPSQQLFRIYQEVNNLRLLTAEMSEVTLDLKQRNAVVELLEQGEATFSKIMKNLGLPGTTKFNLQDIKRDRLKGNATSILLSRPQYFGKAWYAFSLDKQDQIVDRLLYEESEQALVDWLQKHTGIDERTAESVANVSLPEGYGNLSKKALERILPELQQDVIVYSDAVKRAGFDSHSDLSLVGQTGEIMQTLPYYGDVLTRHTGFDGKIANPTVHIGLNQVRRVVNAIIRRYGHPSEIIVEVARDLKLSRERKNEIQREQAKRQERNKKLVDDACEVLGLNPAVIGRSKRRDLSQRMQLWAELNPVDAANRRCPYTGEPINITRLLSDEVEIEHILPYSMTLDDSMNNKTVALRRANRDKGNRSPYDAFGRHALDGYDYDAILQRALLMSKAKARRFAPDGYENWQNDRGFLARALNDTAYFSRITKEYLSLICPPNNVRAIPGRMTALLRAKYGLNELLSGSELKNRDDHRHHAIDAAVVAITDQGLLQRFASASASAREKQLDRLVEEMPLPWPYFRQHIARAVGNIIVSHKPDHSYQGAIHEETAWGINKEGLATRLIRPEDGGAKTRIDQKQKLVMFNSTNDPERHGVDEQGQPKCYKGYKGGSNYCIEIVQDEEGKWSGEVISTYDAYQIIRSMGEDKGYQRLRHPSLSQSGKQLVMRLMIGDIVAFSFANGRQLFKVVAINGNNGQIFFAEHFEANVDARNRDKSSPYKYLSKTAGSLKKAGGRQVIVSEIGDYRLLAGRY